MASALLLRNGSLRRGRGATRNDGGVRTSASLARMLVPVVFLLLVVMAIDMGASAFRDVASAPIREVSVNGDFRVMSQQQIEALIRPHLGIGYFLVDLQAIREELEALPLVHEVTVRRGWPDRLMVFITEQVPVLQFGDHAYLNPYADAFEPAASLGVVLPRVDGPAGSEKKLMKTFHRFSEMLEQTGLGIRRLVLDGKHAWRVELDNGTEVLLGRRAVNDRFATLVALLAHQLSEERDQLVRVDMRYSNGVSVLRGEPDARRTDSRMAITQTMDKVN